MPALYTNNFIYDRDYNVTGTVQTSFNFKPSYGTVVSFTADLTSYTTVDNYIYSMPRGLNHLQAEIQMPFENRTESEATKIASFFENFRGTGYFLYTDPASIYQPVNLFCNDIETNFTVNNIYSLKVNLSTDQAAPLLKWNGMFVTGANLRGNWSPSTNYFKYDIVRYTGSALYPKHASNLYDSYYYCMEDHTSQNDIGSDDLPDNIWSREFFHQPTYSAVLSKKTSVLKTDLPYSFVKKSDFGKNANTLNRFEIQFKGISDRETRSILHFLANRQGYRKFQYKIPNIYNENKFFFAPEWQHTFVYKNVNDISITLIEDPVGIRSFDVDKMFYQISAGNQHSLAIGRNGRAWGWGANTAGRLGDNSQTLRITPVSVAGSAKTFRYISAGGQHSIAIDKYGRAWGWGSNGYGQIGENSVSERCTPVSVAGAVKTFCKISAGSDHSLAIDKYGRVWGWGYGYGAQLGNNLSGISLTPVSVAGAKKTFCWISAGSVHSLAIDKYGRAWAWGSNDAGQLGNNSLSTALTPVSIVGSVKTFCKISASANHSVAIDKYGRAWTWGFNSVGQLGNNSTTNCLTPVSVAGVAKTFCKISSGGANCLAIDKYGRVWGWGYNNFGQLGDNSTTNRLTPVSLAGAAKTFCLISAGDKHCLAIDKNGRAWGWGYNGSGRLGDNSTIDRLTPVRVCNI